MCIPKATWVYMIKFWILLHIVCVLHIAQVYIWICQWVSHAILHILQSWILIFSHWSIFFIFHRKRSEIHESLSFLIKTFSHSIIPLLICAQKIMYREAGFQGSLIFEGLPFYFYWLLCLRISISCKHFTVVKHLIVNTKRNTRSILMG